MKIRDDYEVFLLEAKTVAEKWGIKTVFKEVRMKTVKTHFDELSLDHRFNNREEMFKSKVFLCVIDIVTFQIESRFEGMRTICKCFSFLQPQNFVQLNSTDLMKSAAELQKKYEKDVSDLFPLQLSLLQKVFKSELSKLNTIKDLAELLIIKYPDMSSSFNEVISVLILFLTIPVTVATAERSFSKLKLIKNYMRTTMTQRRLSALALLAVEAEEEAAHMETKHIISDFASVKARRKQF